MAGQPSQHFGMFIRGVVIHMAVALHAATDHRAVEHAERGERGSGAVPLIIVGHRLAAPGLDRSSAWIWLFSSRLSTTAWAGGST